MSKSTPLSKEETKERIRAALDILGRFTDADGKLNATKMSRRIRELEAEVARLELEVEADNERWRRLTLVNAEGKR